MNEENSKNSHLIKEIEIRTFKCFNNFKADGLNRVNLIGGKNNIGKTALMEAIYIYTSKKISTAYRRLLVLKTYRNMQEMLLSNNKDEHNLKTLILENDDINIGIEQREQVEMNDDDDIMGVTDKYSLSNTFRIIKNISNFQYMLKDKPALARYIVDIGQDMEVEGYTELGAKNHSLTDMINILNSKFAQTKYMTSKTFIGSNLNDNVLLEQIIGDLKLNDKYDTLNKYLHKLFGITNIDFINKKPMIKINNQYQELSKLGEGIKSITFYIGSLLSLKSEYFFIDEIDNGIHNTLLDELWKIILIISEERNVQVFATTHSKECIESYVRVAEKLQDKEISFIELGKNEEGILKSISYDYDEIINQVKQEQVIRGW